MMRNARVSDDVDDPMGRTIRGKRGGRATRMGGKKKEKSKRRGGNQARFEAWLGRHVAVSALQVGKATYAEVSYLTLCDASPVRHASLPQKGHPYAVSLPRDTSESFVELKAAWWRSVPRYSSVS